MENHREAIVIWSAVTDFLALCLAKDPDQRFTCAAELAETIDRL